MIILEDGPFFTFLVRDLSSGDARRIEFDAQFPDAAALFGWSGNRDDHSSSAIWDAYAFLDAHVGATVDDPSYF